MALLPFNLGIPSLKGVGRTTSTESIASHLSDHDIKIPSSTFALSLPIIQHVYMYFNRFQRYLFLLGGSEECKDNSYNQVQIINLRNISDIKQQLEYPYTNFRLKPHLWRDKMDYTKYFKPPTKKNLRSSLSARDCLSAVAPPSIDMTPALGIVTEGKTQPAAKKRKAFSPTPISVDIPDQKKKENPAKKRDSKTMIKISSPSSPWTSQNSPYFDSSALIPFNALRNKPRSKSVSKLSKLQKKEAPQAKMKKMTNKKKKLSPKSKSTKYKITPKKKTAVSAKGSKGKKTSKMTITPKKKVSPKKNSTRAPKRKTAVSAKGNKGKKASKKKSPSPKKRTKGKSKKRALSVKVKKSNHIQTFEPVPKRIPKPKKPLMKRKGSAANIRSIPVATKKPKASLAKLSLNKPKHLVRRKSANDLQLGKRKGKKGKKKMNIVTGNKEFDRYSYGQCMMPISNDVNGAIPSWPWFKAKYKSEIKRSKDRLEFCAFKMFVRCGGIYTRDDEYTAENDLFLFNAASLNDVGREIDTYFCTLPRFKQKMESPGLVYNGVDNLLSFGGYSYDEGKALKSIYSLNLNTKRSKFKWRKYGCQMNKPRYDVSVTQCGGRQNKFIIIGGKGSSTKPIDVVEMFDSSKCTLLAELNFKRFKPGSCQLHGINEGRIAVAGGILYGKGVSKVEIYDANKDEWIVHHTPLQYDHQHPTMWSEVPQMNPNILYCAGNNISFGAKKGSLGFIEWTDLRVKNKQFNLLYDESIEELFEFWALRPNIWEPRSLIQFKL
eukprot:477469_1